GVSAQEGDELGDVVGAGALGARLQLFFGLAGYRFDHATERVRADTVRADVVSLHVHRDIARQPGDAKLGGAVIDLPHAADQPGGRGDVNETSAFLLAEMR